MVCLERMDAEDLAFQPCTCNFRICPFCYKRLQETGSNGGTPQCPNCRRPYDESTISFESRPGLGKRNNSSKAKLPSSSTNTTVEQSRREDKFQRTKQRPSSGTYPRGESTTRTATTGSSAALMKPARTTASGGGYGGARAPSSNCRVVLPTLLFVQGIPLSLGGGAESWVKSMCEKMCRRDASKASRSQSVVDKVIFTHTNSSHGGDAILEVEATESPPRKTAGGRKGDTCGAFITFNDRDLAMEALLVLNHHTFQMPCEDKVAALRRSSATRMKTYQLRAFLGTSKYCQNFLVGKECSRRPGAVKQLQQRGVVANVGFGDVCMYMHEAGDPEAIFTKDEISVGLHLRYQEKLVKDYERKRRPRSPRHTTTAHLTTAVPDTGCPSESAWTKPITAAPPALNGSAWPVEATETSAADSIFAAPNGSPEDHESSRSTVPAPGVERDSGCCSSASADSPLPTVSANIAVASTNSAPLSIGSRMSEMTIKNMPNIADDTYRSMIPSEYLTGGTLPPPADTLSCEFGVELSPPGSLDVRSRGSAFMYTDVEQYDYMGASGTPSVVRHRSPDFGDSLHSDLANGSDTSDSFSRYSDHGDSYHLGGYAPHTAFQTTPSATLFNWPSSSSSLFGGLNARPAATGPKPSRHLVELVPPQQLNCDDYGSAPNRKNWPSGKTVLLTSNAADEDNLDGELGFDPWAESHKALSKMM